MVGEGGAGIEQVLAVVEDEERGLRGEEGGRRGRAGSARRFAQAEGGSDGDGHEDGVGERREFDEPDARGKSGEEIGGEGEGEAGLAAAADAGEGEQALIGVEEEIAQRGKYGAPPDEWGAGGWQPGAEGGGPHHITP